MTRRAWLPAGDGGLGTVFVLAIMAILLTVLGGTLALGQTLIARHRAASAADLAALAGADRALEGSATACAAAAAIAAEHAARLVECRLAADVVEVTAAVPLPAALRALGPATARARAGPAHSVTGMLRLT
jgi:secretion/DNA translocation related TadE-like protein